MVINLLLKPSSKGDVFESSYDDFEVQAKAPENRLPSSHPFQTLWKAHLTSLTRPGLYDPVIDAFICLLKGRPNWRSSTRTSTEDIISLRAYVREILRDNAPGVVIISGDERVYGFHSRRQVLWQFVCVSQRLVDRWMVAEEGSLSHLGLTALLKTTLDHELGHWFFTLKTGFFSPEIYSALQIKDVDLRRTTLSKLPSTLREEMLLKNTSKKMVAPWNPDEGHSGNFVEVYSRGGIMEFAYGSGEGTMHWERASYCLPASYLKVYEEDSAAAYLTNKLSLRYTPPAESHASKDKTVVGGFFPTTSDQDDFPSSGPTEYDREVCIGYRGGFNIEDIKEEN
ncbi:hypothetical protein CPB84DRAFT_1775223 [Gymnopilus junonius]|uniref:Uncharacterized protein n=1 Tax=Gymnopilus junonius TaxID=109634 RepID=A0A9P5NT78_GYMJU|nr:hypothetical protein CPB84DRAFT_1775223 [Gymnopilus junonius]